MRENSGEKKTIICRCRDVTEADIRRAIAEGYDTLELLKRKTMVGTGTCGGRTCLPLVRRILTEETNKTPEKIELPRERAPIIPVPTKYLAGERGEADDG